MSLFMFHHQADHKLCHFIIFIVRGSDIKMRFYILSFFTILSLLLIIGCGSDSNNAPATFQQGDIFGTVTDKDTGTPIKGASVQIDTKIVQTDEKGKYIIKEMPFSDKYEIIVTAKEYKEYRDFVSLQQEFLSFDVKLISLQSPSTPILTALDTISKDIESLDAEKIPEVQSFFSKTYVASNDEATTLGVVAGVVPPDYNSIPVTINNIIKKYNKLTFKFANPGVKFDGNSATVQMRFMINAETKPPEPKLWEIVIDGKMICQKQNDVWKITFWGLIPPFLKFDGKPL